MKIIQPSFQILDHSHLLSTIERGGRVCYKSEDKIQEGSAVPLIERLIDSKHDSVLEHGAITVHLICDRGVTHELVRHRLASFSQESTRYCNYGKDKFGGEVTFIEPFFWSPDSDLYKEWKSLCLLAESHYLGMLRMGASPQEARSVLPNSLKTEIVVTSNPREWRHILKLRTAKEAHPQMRQVMVPLGWEFASRWPVLFGESLDPEHSHPAINRGT